MSNVYTLRPSESESKDIKALMKHYRVGHATAALLTAAKDLPVIANDHAELKIAYQKLTADYFALVNTIKEKNTVENKIAQLIETL